MGGSVNHCVNRVGQGSVGCIGWLVKKAMGMDFVKFDVENEVPIRDPVTGFCVRCAPNEVGEMIGKIRTMKTADGESENFEGYTDAQATEKKILRDVFEKGDKYFRSGDLLRQDAQGYIYF